MLLETLQRVLGKEAEPDWVQFQSFVFDLIKAGATQTETLLLKQDVAGECVDLLDDCSLVFLQVF